MKASAEEIRLCQEMFEMDSMTGFNYLKSMIEQNYLDVKDYEEILETITAEDDVDLVEATERNMMEAAHEYEKYKELMEFILREKYNDGTLKEIGPADLVIAAALGVQLNIIQ